MFYKMIEQSRDRWYASPECTVVDLINCMTQKGYLRDAQIEAIKTYLFLKIACGNEPLHRLFSNGKFNSLNLDDLEISNKVREYFAENPAAAALYEYSCLTNDADEMVAAKLAKQIRTDVDGINYKKFFYKAFYEVSYTDYLFSLPMGAGKTYLMAAFIYLDLYFASQEPNNPAFAHNFIVFAPSGLKSSVVPSLKTIQKFDPSWVIPEPAASALKRQISFEVLDQGKTANKSNKTKNPNVQKIANHQPLSELFGLVAVTNAEKVILDRIQEKKGQLSFFEESDDDKDRQANELRNLIGKLPGLAIFIDEVHHAVSDEIKLRAVVNRWAVNNTVNSVIGFSGTPYLEKAEKIPVVEKLSVATAEITNIVYYYPLIEGVGNFLKRPVVKISDIADSSVIIEAGVREFLNTYKDKTYAGGLTAKLGIYCGTIEKLEEVVYPLVSRIVTEYGLSADVILKFHKGNKQYPQPADSQMQFDTLDNSISRIRIILLVQIGKEGWDCRSLTGIILSQEGDCPKNMVLQTSCRCLRQVEKGMPETALIYLNDTNADKLNTQLQQQHRISLKEFQEAGSDSKTLKRYNRTKYLKLPKIDFYQLRVNYVTQQLEAANPVRDIPNADKGSKLAQAVVKTTDLTMETQTIQVDDEERGTVPATFSAWLMDIVKGSFGTLNMAQLKPHEDELRVLFDAITYEQDISRYYSSKYDRRMVEANVRKAFCDRRSFTTQKFDLRKDWQECRKQIRGIGDTLRTDLLDGIDETTFLTTVALYTSYVDKQNGKVGTVSCKKKDVLNLSYESYIANRDQVLIGYRIARDFLLKYQYVFRQRDLPYTTQLIPLSAICAYMGKSKCNEPDTIAILSKWYWCGILGEMYGGANETRYANDIEDVIDEVFHRPNPARTVNSAFFSSTRLLTLQTRLSAAYKGIMALLYKEKCRDFMNDTTIDIVNSMLESPDIHHIFPEAYCARQGIKRQRYNSIVNKTPILPATNRSIGGNAPSEYTKAILKKVSGLTEDDLKQRIESHCVNYEMLVADDFDAYFIDRAKKLLSLIEKAMGKPVSDRNAETTIEQFGASLL